jgi:hypothetical protein
MENVGPMPSSGAHGQQKNRQNNEGPMPSSGAHDRINPANSK